MRKNNFLLILLFIGITTILNAQTWTQIGEDIDGQSSSEQHGSAVSISSDGSIVAVSSPYSSNTSGHVKIYRYTAGTWSQIGSDIIAEAEYDNFGFSVSLSSDGSIVAIGARLNDGNGNGSGHVRIYKDIEGNWIQVGEDIDGEAEGDNSGYSVSLSSDGSIVAIGAPYNDVNGAGAGHVRIYENIGETWTQIGSDIDGEAAGDNSGFSVSLSSNGIVVAIGAPKNDESGSDAGHVRTYLNNEGSWVQLGQDIDGEAAGDNSGYSVCLNFDGSVIAIGAPYNDGNENAAGHARVYQINEYNWTQIGSDIDGRAEVNKLGHSVSLNSDGSVVVVGAPYSINYKGYAKVYQNNSGSWLKVGSDINGEESLDESGSSVCINTDGSVIAIGAPYNDGNAGSAGHARVYSTTPGLGIKDLAEAGISIYPNPTNGIVKLDFAGNNAQKLRVADITGKTVFEKMNVQKNETIDLSAFANGIYIIMIETEEGNYSSKIIKE
jgi:Secretion system C-terminal sorting domain/FG-GAP repeat